MQPITRTCIREVCKKDFVVTAPNQRACPECQDVYEQERRHGYYVDVELPNIDRVYELHAIARAKRCPPKIIPCVMCRKMFVKKRSAVTCDNPECRKQNKINVRAEYDDRERNAVNRKRREKRAADRKPLLCQAPIDIDDLDRGLCGKPRPNRRSHTCRPECRRKLKLFLQRRANKRFREKREKRAADRRAKKAT
jgi:hypothetical protein